MYRGEPYALSMHPEKFRRIADRDRDYTYTSAGKLGFKFKEFLVANGYEMKNDYVTINVAGKNFASFDLPFLRKIEGFCKHVNIRHRIIDPSILYWESGDEKLPDTETCKKRAGIDGIIAHNSIDDCLDVVKLLRYSFNKE